MRSLRWCPRTLVHATSVLVIATALSLAGLMCPDASAQGPPEVSPQTSVLHPSPASKAAETASTSTMMGDGLVLVRTDPGKLCYDNLVEGSVSVRSTYESGQTNTIVYEAGRDYVVDWVAGTIA
ncbi:MAG: hypothetical protein NTU83_06050, partial [Candidatus Hydrogenedentes bacterium]|nr:hypothetical protein [Candidatus Hydrogenedentota bacterium]